jgi:hypothetical protein
LDTVQRLKTEGQQWNLWGGTFFARPAGLDWMIREQSWEVFQSLGGCPKHAGWFIDVYFMANPNTKYGWGDGRFPHDFGNLQI